MAETSLDLTGRVAVVSGASSGIGAAAATRLAGAGASVVVGGRSAERAKAVVAAIEAEGGSARSAIGDVADPAVAMATVAAAVDTYGRLDVLVNAAGIIHRGDAEGTTDQQWRQVMATNVDGVFFLSRAALAPMRAAGGGSIVNVSSTNGLVGAPGLAVYCASKGAVTQLTRAMALDHAAEGIRVNAVNPGGVDTPMLFSQRPDGMDAAAVRDWIDGDIPQGRMANADEVADLILFLASDMSSHIVGANMSIDGGYTAL